MVGHAGMTILKPSHHARLSASSAERWVNCPGSPNEAAKWPNVTTFEAAQGTFAHHLAAMALMGVKQAPAWLGERGVVEGFTIECDQEMVDGVQAYVDDHVADYQEGDETWIEVSLHAALQKLDPDFGGTADRIRWRPKASHLLVHDFKFGAGVLVEPEDNRQLKKYALGALLETGVPAEWITVRITQPRIEHPEGVHREWTFAGIEIVEFAIEIIDAAKATREPNAPLVAGPWCKKTFCPAAANCPALVKASTAMMLSENDFAVDRPYDKASFLKALDMIPAVKARIKALEELAYHEANAGRLTAEDGWKLVNKRATRRFTDEAAVVAIVKAVGVDPYEPQELRSPAQMEKALKGQKAAKEAIQEHIKGESSGTTLVHVTDERQEVKRLSADDFAVTVLPAPAVPAETVNLFN
jgi:hypothetical protein